MIDVVIIGSGSVAEHLALEVERAPELRLVQVFARNAERGSWLAGRNAGSDFNNSRTSHYSETTWTDRPAELAPADIYIMSVSDAAVGPFSKSLPFPEGAVVAHTAGSVHIDEIDNRVAARAVLYPLQSFTKGRRIGDFRRTPFFIEGATPRALDTVRKVAEALSDNIIEMDSDRRARVHMAGSFANNFTNLMFSIAEEIVEGVDAPFDYVKPIIAETVAKAMDMPSPRLAQTGPAQRGDMTIQARHLAMLAAEHPEYVELYKLLSRAIAEIKNKS